MLRNTHLLSTCRFGRWMRAWGRYALGLGLLGVVMLVSACWESRQEKQKAMFAIKVMAWTSDKVGIPGAKVYIDGKLQGQTDALGIFVGAYAGEVGKKIRIRVQSLGQDNYIIVKERLRLVRTKRGLKPYDIKVNAFLHPPDPQALPAMPQEPLTQDDEMFASGQTDAGSDAEPAQEPERDRVSGVQKGSKSTAPS
ncbi:MAG: hypothetical protein AAGJ35_14075, partial [Myxococcota bacterium]